MKSRGKILFTFFALMLFALSISKSFSQSGVTLYPSQGTVFTDITLKAFVPINSKNNVYWDDSVIALYVPVGQEHLPLTMQIKCPNQHPYSDLGNHTITVESFYWDGDYKVMYMNTTFEIIEYHPCAEWFALNATYHALLADYDALNASHNALQTQCNDLNNTYQELQADYNTKLANYSSLSKSYDSLCTSYNSLLSNNDKLTTSYNALISELATARNLGYVFITTTMILIAMTVYFAVRKPKITTT